ncbi:MAG: cysteine peptidase family C39 domain-containing protein [Xenococcaceae cyanobacterium MO_234.B1]|nr:cysteine peptidase family C39 domain-containing protein [Xenococcaceae cyanobacterium MO_234.B1]
MKHNSKFEDSSLLIPSPKEQPILQLLSETLKLTHKNAKLVSDLSQSFEIIDLPLGECLLSLPISLPNYVQNEHNCEYFYIVCQGRVRLLSFEGKKNREVSVQLLTEGETFGGDFVFCDSPLPYRAVAASAVQVARINLQQLKPWLEVLPELRENWLGAAQTRQRLLFFRTLPFLGSLSSQQVQKLLAYIEEKRIPAGEYLARTIPGETGLFWLRKGKIEGQPLNEGCSWEYLESIPPDWVAQKDLWLYWLPKQNWEQAVAIAPTLASAFPESSASNGKANSKTISIPVFPSASSSIASPRKAPPPPPPFQPLEQVSTEIEFPKPIKRRRWWATGYPFIEQQSSSDCGAACLAMISQYWGKRLSLNYLRDLAGVGRSGASLKNLAKAAERLGYIASPVRASLKPLMEQNKPWIAHWQGNHYVVVYRLKGDRILIADPAQGKRTLSRQEFIANWTGYALLLDPTQRLNEVENQKASLARFMGILWHWRSLGLQIILVSLLIQMFSVVSPMFTQIILDQVVVNKSMTTLNVFVIGAFIFGIWSMALSSVRQYLLSYFANRLDLTAIGAFIKHALSLPLKFFEARQVGDIITRVQENQKIQRFLISQIMLAWLDLLTGFVYLGLMLYYNWKLTLLVLALIPPIVILTLAATPLLRRVSRENFNAAAKQQSSLVEMLTGVSTVKAVAAEQELRWRWEEHLTHQLNVRFKAQKLGINLGLISGLINSIGGTALLWYGASLVIQDHLTIGQFVAFNMMKGHVLSPALALANLWDELQEVLISVERLNDVFDTSPEEIPGKPLLTLPRLRGEVRFENVTFRYDIEEQRNTLQNISFEVQAGETVAIVGRSGSGKTSLVKLLQALYYPTSGTIWIDGHDIRHISPHSLRSQLGVVPQECFLFSGTILENITLYRSEFSLEQAIEVAKLAEAHAFIQSMPLGYNTKVGERGANLSGGQRQRIAIARALLGEPRILILDEATSSLDTESERRFQQNLTRLSRERTTFIIAHRLSTVRNADCILVLDQGILAEKGTHQELMAKQGLYYHLAQQQLAL